jgi:hypothetical protein
MNAKTRTKNTGKTTPPTPPAEEAYRCGRLTALKRSMPAGEQVSTLLTTAIRSQVESFIDGLREKFDGEYDYIEGMDKGTSLGLEHVDGEVVQQKPLEVAVGIGGIDQMALDEVDELHEEIKAYADQEGVRVETTSGTESHTEYTFYLHNQFFDLGQ